MKCPGVGWAGMWVRLLLAGVLLVGVRGEARTVYFANGSDIQELTVVAQVSHPHQVVAGLADAEALDYNPLDGRIYWIDGVDKRISRVFSNGSSVETVVTFDLTRPAGIAVDPLGGNIFFSDKGQRRISVATQTGQYRRVLLWENLTSPEALQVDLTRGLLFWLDTGPPARIERARVDGTDRSIVINLSDPGTYHGLAVDTQRQRLYWTRTRNGGAVIEYCFYNGSGREVLAGEDLGDSTPYAVTVWQDTLFWSQLSSGGGVAGSIFSRELDGTVATLYEKDSLNPYDIVHAFTNRTFPGSNPCQDSGGLPPCGKICVVLSSTERMCLCESGELEMDGGTGCSPYLRNVLLVGYRDQIRVLVLERGQPEAKATLDFQLPTEAGNVNAIAYDSDVGVVWSEDHSQERGIGVIKVAQVNSTGITVRRLLSVAASSVSVHCTLAQKLVFWVDTVLGVIGVVDVRSKNPYVIFDQGLNSPRALVLHRKKRLLLWVEQAGDGAAIFNSTFSGGQKQELYRLKNRSKPVAMAINETTDELYWVDLGLMEIGYAVLNGSQTRRLVALSQNQFVSDMTLLDGYLYLTDRDGAKVQRIFPGGGTPQFEDVFGGLHAPKAVVAQWQERNYHSDSSRCDSGMYCIKENQFCFPAPFGSPLKATCKCSYGYHFVESHDDSVCNNDPSYYVVGGDGVAVLQDLKVVDTGQHQFSTLRLPAHSLDIVVAHYRSRTLLWYDSGKKGIYSATMDYEFNQAMNPAMVVNLTGHGPVGGMDVDWLGGNLFWTLPQEGRIDYVSVDGLGHRVFKSGLDGLTMLAVNSENRTVYWVQRLESAKEVVRWCWFDDCSSPQELYRLEEGKTIQKLFFEVQEKSLFSLVPVPDQDGVKDVDYYNFHTNELLNLRREKLTTAVSLASWGENVFLLVNNSNHSQLVLHVKQHGQVVDPDSLGTNATFHDITILSPISQRGFHVCQFGKAGCSHVCLPLREGFVCQCPPHMVLEENGKNCTNVTLPFILVSTRTELLLGSYQVSATASLSRDMLQAVPFTGKDIQFIQYDPYFKEVFVLDAGTRELTAVKIGDWQQRTVVRFSHALPWSRLQYDRLGGNLFWSEAASFIEGVGRPGGMPQVIEFDRRTHFMDIAADSPHGRLFWIAETNYNSIGIYSQNITSSSGPTRVPVRGLRRPVSLVYDEDHGNLFWVDMAAINTVWYYNVSSQTTHELARNVAVGSTKPLLREAEEYVYWFEPEREAIMKSQKTVGQSPSMAVTGLEGVTDFVVTLSHYAPSFRDVHCLRDNRPCKYWCTHSIDLSTPGALPYECACPYGYSINQQQECKEPSCSSSEVQCQNSKQCISLTYECNGHEDCPDGTDELPHLTSCPCPQGQLKCDTVSEQLCVLYEERCTEQNLQRCINWNRTNLECFECDPTTQFMCADQSKCVDIRFRCEADPYPDCADGSDEKNCNYTETSVTTPPTSSTSSPQEVGDQPAIVATTLLLSLGTSLVLIFLAVLLFKYIYDKRVHTAAASQNGSSARLTRMSVSTAQGGDPSQSEVSFCSSSTLTKETHVSSATETDMPFLTRAKTFHGSDCSVETMVTTDPLASDPPPSPITQRSVVLPQPSIMTSDPEYPEDLPSYRAPNPSVNFSCTSEFDKFSSVSEVKPRSVHKPQLKAHFQPQLQGFDLDYLSGGNPSDVVSLASNSHCTPPPPPSPVTFRSTYEISKDECNYASSSSTMV